MPNFYVYFISTLPSLNFLQKPPFDFARFSELCQRFLAPAELELVANGGLPEWQNFDLGLRNELVKIRAGRKHLDPAKYLRQQETADLGLAHLAVGATRNPSPLEVEKQLDLARWNFLDELSGRHYFDLEAVIIYGAKLRILERWEKIENADQDKLMEAVLTYS